jgi:LDH2 family malate/lactate/ureidoglycolate dehydrogenase
VLGGGAMCSEVGGIRIRGRALRVSQMYLGIDIARFMPVAEFTARMERLVELMKSTPPAKGYDEVLVAGEPEWRMEAERKVNGIPVEEGTWQAMLDTASRLRVQAPALSPISAAK